MAKLLTEAQVETYGREGFLSGLPALWPDEVADFRAALEGSEAAQGAALGAVRLGARAKSHLLYKWADAIVRLPAVLDAVEDLIGPDILVYHLTCWAKDPGDGKFVSWHQDATYFGLFPHEHVTAWIALTDSTEETGCVEVLPGSHRLGQLEHELRFEEANLLSRGQTIDAAVDTRGAARLELRAGQFSLHHTHLVHRSQPNRGADRRIGIGVSYIPTRVRHVGPRRLTAQLVRGIDHYGNFDPEPRPDADLDPAAVRFHQEACARFFAWHNRDAA